MGLEAVSTVETLAAELTVDQAAWKGYVQKYHPNMARLSEHFSNYYINSVLDPYPIGSRTFCPGQIRIRNSCIGSRTEIFERKSELLKNGPFVFNYM
jgi:hypothetical protein